MGKDAYFSSNRLRVGRWSSEGQIYLITTVTKDRQPLFQTFTAARAVIHAIRDDAARGSHKTLAFVVMPDHLHWLLELRQESLSRLVGRVKSISAKRIGEPIWQDGFHDRALRKEEELKAIARYVVANPIRAGLVERIGDYPHWDAIWL